MGISSSRSSGGCEPEYLNTLHTRHHGHSIHSKSGAGATSAATASTCLFRWHPLGRLVACSGAVRVVQIFDPQGQVVDQVVPPYPSVCTGLEWSRDGSVLAVCQAGSAVVVLWSTEGHRVQYLDTNVKDVSVLSWSRAGRQLAIGTGKGSLLLYDHDTGVRTMAAAKHKKRVVCADWSDVGNVVAFASEDKQVTVCSVAGSTMEQVKVKSRPFRMRFGLKAEQAAGSSTLCINLDGRTLLLHDLADRTRAIELLFRPRYGSLTSSFRWLDDGYIMVWFSLGFVVVISTRAEEIGQEQFCARFHEELRDASYCRALGKVATVGDGVLKIIDVHTWVEESQVPLMEEDSSMVQNVTWTPVADTTDGRHIVSVVSRSGCLFNYLVKPARQPPTTAGATTSPIRARHGAGSARRGGASGGDSASASWTGALRGVAHKVAAPFSFAALLLLLAAAVALLLLALAAHLHTSPSTVARAVALMWGSSGTTGTGPDPTAVAAQR